MKYSAPLLSVILVVKSTSLCIAMSADDINRAAFEGRHLPADQSPFTVAVQVLLDRAGASPGVIDGFPGENVEKAIRAFEKFNGLPADGKMDEEIWSRLQTAGAPIAVPYQITAEDVSGLSEKLPQDYAELARLDHLGYTSVAEKLAERFHMDIDLLKTLNKGKAFSQGETITVVDPGDPAEIKVARLEADKSAAQLLAYDDKDRLVLSYPVTIGSRQTPSPTGRHQVTAVAIDPTYSYRPDENFQQGDNDEPLTLPPGPNGPVGTVWIDLSEPTYGIHGTPEPAEIDKTASHGCVRMTNWDATELAELVRKGTTVEFVE